MGHLNWGYDELEPLFAKSETTLNRPESQFRGKTGLFAKCCDSGQTHFSSHVGPWMNQVIYESPFKPHG